MINRYYITGLLCFLYIITISAYEILPSDSYRYKQYTTEKQVSDGNSFGLRTQIATPFSGSIPSGAKILSPYSNLGTFSTDGYDPNETDEPGIGVSAPLSGGVLFMLILTALYAAHTRLTQKKQIRNNEEI